MDFKQGLFSSVCGLELRDYLFLIHWGILKNKVSVVFLLFDRRKNKGAAESQSESTHTRTMKRTGSFLQLLSLLTEETLKHCLNSNSLVKFTVLSIQHPGCDQHYHVI